MYGVENYLGKRCENSVSKLLSWVTYYACNNPWLRHNINCTRDRNPALLLYGTVWNPAPSHLNCLFCQSGGTADTAESVDAIAPCIAPDSHSSVTARPHWVAAGSVLSTPFGENTEGASGWRARCTPHSEGRRSPQYCNRSRAARAGFTSSTGSGHRLIPPVMDPGEINVTFR